jgi:ferredoxin, 2Fe-2S
MMKITIKNLKNSEIVFNNSDKTLISHIGDAYIDWMQACGQKGRCVTCRATIVSGAENLSELTAVEQKFLTDKKLKINERLCCQAKLLKGELIISVPNSCKLPHVKYYDYFFDFFVD